MAWRWRPRNQQWVEFYLKGDPYNEQLHELAKIGAHISRGGKLVGIYMRSKRYSDLVMIPPHAPVQEQGGWVPECIMLVDKHIGANLAMTLNGKPVAAAFVYAEGADDLDPILDRADLPPGRYVHPQFVFRP